SAARKMLHTPRFGTGCEAFPPVAAEHPSNRAVRTPVCWIFRGGVPTSTPSKARRSDIALPPKQRLKTRQPRGGARQCAPAAAPRRSALNSLQQDLLFH